MTEIYGTLGPACAGADALEAMLRRGMTGVRLNLSHVTLREAAPLTEALREAARRCGAEPKLLIDMQGPELRLGALAAPLELTEGETLDLTALPLPRAVCEALEPGQEVLLDDGKLLLRCGTASSARVERGGTLQSRKSVALPGKTIRLPALTESDRENIALARSYGVTGVMQPFVRSAEDLREVRAALDAAGGEGIEKLPELLPAADELVIARGDLGNAMPLWELPAAQKRVAAVCRAAGKPFMVVTQMLASMEKSPVPTRAELSDIFNAVLDGASSVMVTGETAVGAYPVETIDYLTRTVREAERYLANRH